MLKKILPTRFMRSLDFLQVDRLNEIRLRANCPTIVYYGGKYFLGENGLADSSKDALNVTSQELNDIVFRACECSIYAHNEELKQGFVTLQNGIRIGICGEIVTDKGTIKTIKNFSSLNIRIPREVKNCSLTALPYLHNENGIFNTLVVAPPGAGKTTFIRDLSAQLGDKFIAKNLLIIDERNEISATCNGRASLYVGKYSDIYSSCSKEFGIINGIRTMTPDIIVLDELANKSDIEALYNAVGCGVKVIATTHSKDYNELQSKPFFRELLKMAIFERFVVLSNAKGPGTLDNIWDENNTCLYCR